MQKFWWLLLFGFFVFGCTAQGSDLLRNSANTAMPAPTVVPTELPPSPFAPSTSAIESADIPMPNPSSTSEPSQAFLPGQEVLTFAPGEPGWYVVNDTVMGGISQSQVEILPNSVLRFAGSMSLENNGGFASVRSDWALVNLQGNDGVLIRVNGDGKSYRFRLRTTETGQDVSYNALFPTVEGRWNTIYIPFASMVPTYRGFEVDVAALDPATISSLGFMLSDKQEGDFELQVDWIRAVSEKALEEWQNEANDASS